MFRKLLGFGLLVLLLTGLFGGMGGRRSQAAYYEGYADGLQAQTSESAAESGAETSAPPAAPSYRDGYGNGRFFGWGILGIFAFFFKFVFFLMLMKMMFWLIGGRRWRHRGGPWKRGHWMHHKHGHGERPGKEKSPKWMDDSDDDEPIMTV